MAKLRIQLWLQRWLVVVMVLRIAFYVWWFRQPSYHRQLPATVVERPHSVQHSSILLQQVEQRRIERRRRTTPPTSTLTYSTVAIDRPPVTNLTLADDAIPCPNSTTQLHVTHALSHPLGVPLVLWLHQHCPDLSLSISDPLWPNRRVQRLQALRRWQQLLGYIPGIRWVGTSPTDAAIVIHLDHGDNHDNSFLAHMHWRQLLLLDHHPTLLRVSQVDRPHWWTPPHVTVLQLPTHVYGPYMDDASYQHTADNNDAVYVDRALRAILQVLSSHSHNGGGRYRLAPTAAANSGAQLQWDVAALKQQLPPDLRKTLTWKYEHDHPYTWNHTLPGLDTTYRHSYGAHPKPLPCASSCQRPSECTPSVWDAIVPIAQAATFNCTFVVYLTALDPDQDQLYVPSSRGDELCRVAFVTESSPLVQDRVRRQVSDNNLAQSNGQVEVDGWTVVWLPTGPLSDADYMLPLIDPSQLFHPTVHKAMFVDSAEFAQPSDDALLVIMLSIDRLGHGKGWRKEKRPGTEISRFHRIPPEKARHVVLFGGEPQEAPSMDPLPREQRKYYQQVAHFIQENRYRPQEEIDGTVYKQFPYQWLSMTFLVHDLRLPRAQTLRCDWFTEATFWGGNRDLEEMSLAFVLARYRIEGSLGPELVDDEGWSPFLVEHGEKVSDDQHGHVFFRVMKRRDEED